eukprot:4998349-Ditylum_brightwellii.AAC.1
MHSEKKEKENTGRFHHMCSSCKISALGQLEAVTKGGVVLPADEELPQRGQSAIFHSKPNRSLKTETWKNYASGEAECALAIIAASEILPYTAPLFIA